MPQADADDGATEVSKVREALKMLYDLLEAYAPAWYTREYHDKAEAALRLGEKSGSLQEDSGGQDPADH
jgi:hypothetical protein